MLSKDNQSSSSNRETELQRVTGDNELGDATQNHFDFTLSPLKSSVQFWVMVNFAALSNFLIGYNIGLFNTLGGHLSYIYGWTNSEATLNLTLINSLPQAVAAVICLFVGGLAARFGRRKVLILTAIAALLGNTITLLADTRALILGRLIVGIGFGGWSSIGPLYILEIAPKQFKGLSGILFSLHFGFGILLSFIMGYGLPADPTESSVNGYWRVMLGLPIIFNIFIIGTFLLIYRVDTAAFIMTKYQDESRTRSVLSKYFTERIVGEELIDLKSLNRISESSSQTIGWKELFGPVYLRRLVLITVFTFSFSYSGCNAVNIFSFNIIKESDGASIAQLFTTIFPIGDIIGPIFAAILITKLGRKALYIHGLFFCIAAITAFSISGWMKILFLQKYILFLFKLLFATSVAPVHWIYPSEILPPLGVGFFGCVYWLCSLSTIQFLPYAMNILGVQMTMMIFPLLSFPAAIFLMFKMKETTNKSQQQIEGIFRRDEALLSDNRK